MDSRPLRWAPERNIPAAPLLLLAALTLAGLSSPLRAATSGYTFQTVDTPGAVSVQACQMNNSGLISEQYLGADGSLHAAAFSKGTWSLLDVPGFASTANSAPNSQGQIVLSV